jgi:nitroimidazol reductase NimA-like FMN-containing flavoprotein (pyridoxamine 5'-phosphate oxidase superfamily)
MAAQPAHEHTPPVTDELSQDQCLDLAATAEVGRIAYHGRYGLEVVPVNYRLHEQAIVFRTAVAGTIGEDLRTGIANADYHVAFEIDAIDKTRREGWSVLIQGPAHHIDDPAERALLQQADVQPWPGGEHEQFIRITPARITGRRLHHPGGEIATAKS